MIEYQTRVIDRDGKLSLLVLSIHNSDRAAIQAATKLCRPNETLSVWRDDLCIYDEAPKAGPWLVWPIVSANRHLHGSAHRGNVNALPVGCDLHSASLMRTSVKSRTSLGG